MSRNGLMLVPLALAVAMLVGCRQPVGLPNGKVHSASTITDTCRLVDTTVDQWSGHLDGYAGYMTIDSCVDSFSPTIKRGYYEYQRRPYPRYIGYAVFGVPEFDGSTGVVVCTLCYYQSAHSGSPNLSFRDIGITMAPASKHALYWGAWDSNVIMATDNTHAQNGWYKVALSAGVDSIIALGARGGGNLYTGWVYTGTDNIWTEVYGANSGHSPFIKVVVTN